MEPSKAAIALAMFHPSMVEEIVRLCTSRGYAVIEEVQEVAVSHVQVRPAFAFFKPKLPARQLINLARGLRVLMGDALAGEWDAERYGKALARAASLPQSAAEELAEREIVTPDMATAQFARRLLYSAADLPSNAFDDAQAGVLGGIINTIEGLFTDTSGEQNDVLYELSRVGKVIGDLADRAQLLAEEVEYERAPQNPSTLKDATSAALYTLPLLAKAVISAMGNRMESGDISDGERSEFSDVLHEVGDLIVEGRTITPEQGGIGSFLKRVGRVAKKAVNVVRKVATPLATALVPGASLALDIGKNILPSAGDRNTIAAAAKYGEKYPPVPLSPNGARTNLSDLVRMVNQLRASGVSIG